MPADPTRCGRRRSLSLACYARQPLEAHQARDPAPEGALGERAQVPASRRRICRGSLTSFSGARGSSSSVTATSATGVTGSNAGRSSLMARIRTTGSTRSQAIVRGRCTSPRSLRLPGGWCCDSGNRSCSRMSRQSLTGSPVRCALIGRRALRFRLARFGRLVHPALAEIGQPSLNRSKNKADVRYSYRWYKGLVVFSIGPGESL